MSLYLQGEIWWYEFYVNGKRFRSSTRTTDKAVAKQVETEHSRSLQQSGVRVSATLNEIKIKEAEQKRAKIWDGVQTRTDPPAAKDRKSQGRYGVTPNTLLENAGRFFLEKQRERCRAKTVECCESNLRRLVEFFGNIPLKQFTIAHFEHYQSVRGGRCGPSTVNHELNVLSRILRRVDLWFQIKNYAPLKDPEWKKPKIFTAEEEERIFRALRMNPNLELANIAFSLTRNTTASGCELRGLRLKHLELDAKPPRIHIPPDSVKNNTRPRTIPLNEDALAACKLALERASKMGSHYAEDYLFPLCIDRATWDPKRPASRSWLRKQVVLLREVTGVDHINPHTFRHLAVTELLERGAPEQTVIALAGWVGRRMVETYSHTRMEAKADAVEMLMGGEHKPEPTPPRAGGKSQPKVDLMDPAIQAEIARQVALAMQREREAQPAKGPRLLTFPGAG